MKLRLVSTFAIPLWLLAPPVKAGSPCDLNSDGVVNALDVQLAVNQALGLAACTTGDVDADGTCSIIDVQKIINTALGGSCGATAPFSYTTGFLGNTFGTWATSVPSNVRALAVNAAGVVATNTPWEEGSKEASIIIGGVVKKTPGGHGWGLQNDPGIGVAINSKYAFFSESLSNGNTSATSNNGYGVAQYTSKWPPFDASTATNYQDFGVNITNTDGSALGGGEGCNGCPDRATFYPLVRVAQAVNGVPTGNNASVKALACDDTNLYAIMQGQLKVFSIASVTAFAQNNTVPTPVASWPAPGVTALGLNPKTGDIWAIQNGVVTGYSSSWTPLGQSIADVSAPGAIAFNAAGQLLVADNATDTVRTYNLGPAPGLANIVGTSILSGPTPGAVGSGRFRGIMGLGVDAANNLYVAESRTLLDGKVSAYAPAGSVLWSVQSIGSINIAEPDPQDDTSWYAASNRMNYNYTSGTWNEAAITLNTAKYPHDPRLRITRFYVRYINGTRFLFGTSQYKDFIGIYRFNRATDGEIAIPCGLIVPTFPSDTMVQPPSLKPANAQYIWRDLNGNGDFDAGEFDAFPIVPATNIWDVEVDGSGNVTFLFLNGTIERFPPQGLDASGSPIYTSATRILETPPPPFASVILGQLHSNASYSLGRAIYDSSDDTMILSGYTPSEPLNQSAGEMWGQVGKVVVLYDHWSTTKTLRYQILLPFDPTHLMDLPHAMAVAGDRIFMAEFTSCNILVYQRSTGNFIGTITAPSTGIGWIDTPTGLAAFQRANGQIVLSEEEEVGAKNLLYFVTGGP